MNIPETKPQRTAVSLNDIQGKVKKTTYTVLPDTTTTLCQLRMVNNYTILGTSACVDPAKYNQALGEKYAYEDAINKAWPLEGYLLAEEIFKRGPVIKTYSWRDIATHSQLHDPMTGDVQFDVRMRDGARFMGLCKEQFDTTPIEARIVANINKQLQEGTSA